MRPQYQGLASSCILNPKCKSVLEWCSQFADIFDVDYFIESLRDEVRILKELPPAQTKKVELEPLFSMPPVSWSNMTYYYNTVGSF